jgi:hypothetical protein
VWRGVATVGAVVGAVVVVSIGAGAAVPGTVVAVGAGVSVPAQTGTAETLDAAGHLAADRAYGCLTG